LTFIVGIIRIALEYKSAHHCSLTIWSNTDWLRRGLVMGKEYYGVACGRVLGIYTTWSLASDQTDGFSGACHAGFDDLKSCVEFVVANGSHSEDSIKVHGERGGQYTLRAWIRKSGEEMNSGVPQYAAAADADK
jgi:hypothetical protein